MTVKELLIILAQHPDDMPVLTSATDGMQDWLSTIDVACPQDVRQMVKHPRLQGEYVERSMADYAESQPGDHRKQVKCGPPVTALVLS